MSITTSRPTPTAIRGAIGHKVLTKAPELFDQSFQTILSELLQNSRRAGATRIDFEILASPGNPGFLVLRDDGAGVDDMQKLLTFGESGWDAAIEHGENAAGMGFFSLATRGATVRSMGKRVTLSPPVFTGNKEAIVLHDASAPLRGCEITFPLRSDDNVTQSIETVVAFFPLEVTLNGSALPRKDYLDGAARILTWQGVRIGVFQDRSKQPFTRYNTPDGINFHGHVVSAKLGGITEICGRSWTILVDVIDAPDLRLVLPTRTGIIKNSFSAAMIARGRKAILEHIATLPRHTLPFSVAKEARDQAINMQDARILLKPFDAEPSDFFERRRFNFDDRASTSAPTVLIGSHFERATGRNIEEAIRACNNPINLFFSDDRYIGYRAYDALPHLVTVTYTATLKGGTEFTFDTIEDFEDLDDGIDTPAAPVEAAARSEDPEDKGAVLVAKELTARIYIRSPGTPETTPDDVFEGPADFAATNTGTDLESASFIVREGTSPSSIADYLMETFFNYHSDPDNDCFDTQKRHAERNALTIARRVLLTPEQATAENILSTLGDHLWGLDRAALEKIEILPVTEGEYTRLKISVTTSSGQVLERTIF